MDEAKTEALAFTAFPRNHWPNVWSTNPLERVNKEIKRRARVVGIFPNEPAVIRHLGRHARRMAGQRPPLPIRRLHGPNSNQPAIMRQSPHLSQRLGIENPSKAHHATGLNL
jgi:transposase-like protein